MFKKAKVLAGMQILTNGSLTKQQTAALTRAITVFKKHDPTSWREGPVELIAAMLLRSAVNNGRVDQQQLSHEGMLVVDHANEIMESDE